MRGLNFLFSGNSRCSNKYSQYVVYLDGRKEQQQKKIKFVLNMVPELNILGKKLYIEKKRFN